VDIEKELNGKGDEPERPRYIIRNAAFALGPQPPLEWIINKLISRGSVTIFYGEPGSKKTYAMLSLAVCTALGKNWLGLETKPCKVLIIDEESGERRFTLRLAATIRGELGDDSVNIEFISLAGFKMDNKKDVEEIQKLIEERKADLVIFDALSDIMDGDENSKQDTQPVFTNLRRVAEKTNAAIIIVHHANRMGGYRGSSAIKGSLDLMVKMLSEDDSDWITFKSEKSRDTEPVQFSAVAHWTDEQFYLELAENEKKIKPLNKGQNYVIRYLTQHGASKLPDIMGAVDNCGAESARRAVYDLVDMGKVYRTNPDEKGRAAIAIYDLAKEKNTSNEE
jgi:hypothetical protein